MAQEDESPRERARVGARTASHRTMVEIALIELAFARAEIEFAPGLGEERPRIAAHLAAASDLLDQLLDHATDPLLDGERAGDNVLDRRRKRSPRQKSRENGARPSGA
jgi:hypothetical protein